MEITQWVMIFELLLVAATFFVLLAKKMPVLFLFAGAIQGTVIPIVVAFFCHLIWSSADGGYSHGGYYVPSGVYLFTFSYYCFIFLISMLAMSFGYIRTGKIAYYEALKNKNGRIFFASATSIAIGFSAVLYLHSIFGFSFLSAPRRMYEATRVGYGALFFVSIVFIKFGFILGLFSRRPLFLCILAIFISVLTGSKGASAPLLVVLGLYVLAIHFRHHPPLIIVLCFTCIGSAAFWYLLNQTFHGMDSSALLVTIGRYLNDPFANLAILINTADYHFSDFFLGQIFFENQVISRIPRFLFQEKPLIFGAFRFSQEYYPDATAMMIGAPAFTAFGNFYADFGYLGLFLASTISLFKSFLLGVCLSKLGRVKAQHEKFMYFSLSLIAMGMYFFALPPCDAILENLLLVIALRIFFLARIPKISIHPNVIQT